MTIGKLYIVATPIGNLQDISKRAIETLQKVDYILCEKPANTQKLLNFFDIKTNTEKYNQHTRQGKMLDIYESLKNNNDIALVSDAGTPAISDPAGKLVEYISQQQETIEIIPIPGPSAITAALSVCGFPADEFLFLGFPPHKSGRKKFFDNIADYERTVVFYESKHRINSAIKQLQKNLPEDKEICICRELTKEFETIYRSTIGKINNKDIEEKGEFTIVIDGRF